MIQTGWLMPQESDLLDFSVGTSKTYLQSLVGGYKLETLVAKNPKAIDNFQPPYVNAVKQPDAMLMVQSEIMPSVTLEVGWSQSYPKLKDATTIWMVGGAGFTNVSILIKLLPRTGNRFAAFVEVARQLPAAAGGWGFDPRQVSPILRSWYCSIYRETG